MKRPVLQSTIDYCKEEGITYNQRTGVLAHRKGQPLTNWVSRGAVWVHLGFQEYPAAVLAWALANGLPPEHHAVRQINGDIHDTRLLNLECVPVTVAAACSDRTATGYRNVSIIRGRYRAKVKKAGRYHIRDFDQLEDAVAFVNEIKGVRELFAGKAVIESVTRVVTTRKGKPHIYWRACRSH